MQRASVAPADGQMTARRPRPQGEGAGEERAPLRQNVIRGRVKNQGECRETKRKWGRPLVTRARCQMRLFCSATGEHFVVVSRGTARAIYMQSSSESISAGLKTHAAAVSHQRSLTAALMLGLRNYHPCRLASCSAPGAAGGWGGHHAVRRRLLFCLIFKSPCNRLQFLPPPCITPSLLLHLFSHIFTTGSAVAADGRFLPPVRFLPRAPEGILRGPSALHRT